MKPSNETVTQRYEKDFDYFVGTKKEQIRKDYPRLSQDEVLEILKAVWDAMSEDQRRQYRQQDQIKDKSAMKVIANKIVKDMNHSK